MHELSLVQGLFAQVKEAASSHGCRKVLRVKVEIGPFSGVVMDSFTFAFDALKKEEELLKDAELEVVRPMVTLRCNLCGMERVEGSMENEKGLPGFFFRDIKCPECKDGRLFPAGGDEILLTQIEME